MQTLVNDKAKRTSKTTKSQRSQLVLTIQVHPEHLRRLESLDTGTFLRNIGNGIYQSIDDVNADFARVKVKVSLANHVQGKREHVSVCN